MFEFEIAECYNDRLEVDSWSVRTRQAGTGTLINIAEYHVHHHVDYQVICNGLPMSSFQN